MRYVEAINSALHALLNEDPHVLVLGEDVVDPYGGAFKVTKGLSTRFPSRVISTPVSEAGIVGLANGLALRGFKPVVEIMFGDFLLLALDQLANHAAKYPAMYGNNVDCHIVIRTPMGGYRGYGPTHSQSLEKFLIGVPGLTLVAPSRFHDVGALLKFAVARQAGPVVFIENKVDYPQEVEHEAGKLGHFDRRWEGSETYPTAHLALAGAGAPEVTVVTYGGMVYRTMRAVEEAYLDEEVSAEILIPSLISPMDIGPLLTHASLSHRVLTVEEGTLRGGIGAEVIAAIAGKQTAVGARYSRVAAQDTVIPGSPELEKGVLPSEAGIKQAILALARS